MAVAVEHVSSSGSSSGPRKWATISSFMAQHSDFVHHLAFDYHGHRLATCSADQRIKIWEFITPPQTAVGQGVKQSGSWSPLTTIKAAHGGPVNKVAWAHPQFGTILASCSADRYVKIFEEQIETGSSAHKWVGQAHMHCVVHPGSSLSLVQQVNVAQWYCSPSSVTDLKFSPHSQGRLRLATCSVDGRVRVFEPSEEAKLTNWEEHKSSFQADDKDVLAVDWNPEYSPASSSAGNSDEKTEWTPAGMLAVASQHSVWIWEEQTAGDWTRAFEIRGHGDTVLDVAWAPHMGRSYHLIATACKDHRVRPACGLEGMRLYVLTTCLTRCCAGSRLSTVDRVPRALFTGHPRRPIVQEHR